ncbi:MAG: metallophosphoesterase [Oscillospiraceae bacterium]|nr:metallophosphoesterase [Oscillospiraceae bacterium]
MIYITGDTHIPTEDISKLSTKRFPEQKMLSKEDYVIICGDFGGVWDGSNEEKYWIKWLKERNFTTLFVDGNHENFQALNSLPMEEFCGGTVHRVDDGIYHLMRGEVYTIAGKKFFTFGGGSSHDKEYRTEGKNWWAEELANEDEYRNAREKLCKNNYVVDYVITHSAPTSVQNLLAPQYEENHLTEFLEEVKSKLQYKKWFFGHYHEDKEMENGFEAVFNRIVKL